MTEPRRRVHPAAASRVLVAGLSTATAFALVAGMATPPHVNAASANPPSPSQPLDAEVLAPVDSTAQAPHKVVVVVRPNAVLAVPQPTQPPTPRPRPAPASATPAPVTRSDGS